jgi:hypothetical protein
LAQEGGRAETISRLLALTEQDMTQHDRDRIAHNQALRDGLGTEPEAVEKEAAAGGAGSSFASSLWGLTSLTTKISSLWISKSEGAEAEAEAEGPEQQQQEQKRKSRPPRPAFVHEGMGGYLVMPDRGFPEDSRETPLMAAIMRGDEASVLALLEVGQAV